MKKIISIILVFILLSTNVSGAEISEIEGFDDKYNALFIDKYLTAEQMEELDRSYIEEFNETWPGFLKGLHALGKDNRLTDDEKYEKYLNWSRPYFPNGVKWSFLVNMTKYTPKYANEDKFYFLFAEEEYLGVIARESAAVKSYGFDGSSFESLYERYGDRILGMQMDKENFEFLKNKTEIKKMILNAGESRVDDIKIFAFGGIGAAVYIRCSNNEYIIPLKVVTSEWRLYLNEFDIYNMYPIKDVLNVLVEHKASYNICVEKNFYEDEAVSLQEEGLLYGNENGLDLMKPLTRIEAATMLLRAMGESTEATANVQVFSDVPESHWGYGAAENAYSLGLIKGVGDNKFAPDEKVTSAQFATMVLRAANKSEFDWEKAVEILIKEGIITAEESETMDLFTRGDMAKIIYEARQKGLLH